MKPRTERGLSFLVGMGVGVGIAELICFGCGEHTVQQIPWEPEEGESAAPQKRNGPGRFMETAPKEIFEGYDSVLGEPRQAILAGELYPLRDAGFRCDFSFCMNTFALSRALEIDASASYDGGAYSADGKVKFYRSLNVTENSAVMVVRAVKIEGKKTIRNVTSRPIIKNQTHDNINKFVFRHGDSFVSSLTLGGEYIALWIFQARSVQEKEQIEATLRAKGISTYGAVTADFHTKFDECMKATNVLIESHQTFVGCSSPTIPDPRNIEKMIRYATDFSGVHLDSPSVMAFETQAYDGYVAGLKQVARNRIYFRGIGTIRGVLGAMKRLQGIDKRVDWILARYQFYGGFDDPKLLQFQYEVHRDLSDANEQLIKWSEDPNFRFSQIYPTPKSLTWGVPTLMYLPYRSRSYGGKGIKEIDELAKFDAVVQRGIRLAEVRVEKGDWVNSITCTYEFLSGPAEQPVRYGGPSGTSVRDLSIPVGQYITKAWITYRSNVVTSLQFERTDGSTTQEFPLPREGDTDVFAPAEPIRVIGFAGGCTGVIDRLELVCMRLMPAAWVYFPSTGA